MRYNNETIEKSNGVVYTPFEMANYLAQQMIRFSKIDFHSAKELKILDPAVGSGELLISIITNLLNIDKSISISAVGFETDPLVAQKTQERLAKLFPQIKIRIYNGDFILSADTLADKFDMIIANPPYIRTQILGSGKAQQIANQMSLTGRVDIYYAFILYVQKLLSTNGIAGYITSNKFLTIKSGISVRNFMLKNYKIYSIIDFGDTKLFSASVLPCIIIFGQGKTTDASSVQFTSIYESKDTANAAKCDSIFDCISNSGLFELPNGKLFEIQQGTLQSVENNALWLISSAAKTLWLQTVAEHTWKYLKNIGKIRVGIKTTADNVFIGSNWDGEKAQIELLKPLITHRDSGQIIPQKSAGWKVLYTHTVRDGKKVAIDINDYPISKQYLESFYEQLAGRSYIKASNRNWYEIWVPQNPAAWTKRKIVFRDISAKPEFWLDESGAVVNGDCYWIEIDDNVSEETLYLVLAVVNSAFIEKYYDTKFNTKLYSGKRRYMSQYVEQFPIPCPDSIEAQATIELVKQIIANKENQELGTLMAQINQHIDTLFGV